MTGITTLILLFGAAGIFLAALIYLREEASGSGKPLLLGLRVATLTVVVLLLLDPVIPGEGGGPRGEAGARWVLLDPDLSLLVADSTAGTLWDRATERAISEAARGARLALATPETRGPEGTDSTSLKLRVPEHPPGDLMEGVARLSESGADSILVLSTFRRPPELLERLAEESPARLRLERVGGTTRNAGVAALDLPARAPEGESIEGNVTVFGEGGIPGDSVDVEIRADGEVVLVLRLPLPDRGIERSEPLELPAPPSGAEVVRFSAHVHLEGDAFPIDDVRSRWVEVGTPERGIVLLSLRPDWEPRTLLSVLEAVTGLDGEGYLGLGQDRFLTLGRGSEATRIVASESLLQGIHDARLLVLHGAAAGVPDWIREVARSHSRAIHLPHDTAGAALAGVATNNRWEAAWTVEPELPASPMSPFFTGIQIGGLPPLGAALPVIGTPPGIVALTLRSGQSREAIPGILLREANGGRLAVAMGEGFWRWGVRTGVARDAYRALWGGVADWVLAGRELVAEEGVKPAEIVMPRGAPLRWQVGIDGSGAEVTLRALPLDGEGRWAPAPEPVEAPASRAILNPDEDGWALTPPMDPGLYRWEVRVAAGGQEGPILASGVVEVESWAPSLRLPPLDVGDEVVGAGAGVTQRERNGGRPLRTHPLPYLLILVLLTGEWIGRRRMGLR